jgi:hypothetical protein
MNVYFELRKDIRVRNNKINLLSAFVTARDVSVINTNTTRKYINYLLHKDDIFETDLNTKLESKLDKSNLADLIHAELSTFEPKHLVSAEQLENLRKEMLDRIDYLFEMFFRADSETILRVYPRSLA